MGGGSYSRDVIGTSSSGSFRRGTTSSAVAHRVLKKSKQDPSTKTLARVLISECKSPLVVALDVTGSNIEFARIVYDKAPMLHGQIEQQQYLDDFEICFAATGDAHSDAAPLQVCDFQYGAKLDNELKKIWLERGGGGNKAETYELTAYYFANYCFMPMAKKPFFFMIGDEPPFPTLEKKVIRKYVGVKDSVRKIYDTRMIFHDLYDKFQGNVFLFQNLNCGRNEARTEKVKDQWIEYLGSDNADKIIRVYDEKSIIDLMLGTISMVSGARTLDSYISDMKGRGQTRMRINNVQRSLQGLEYTVTGITREQFIADPIGKSGSLPSDMRYNRARSSGARRL